MGSGRVARTAAARIGGDPGSPAPVGAVRTDADRADGVRTDAVPRDIGRAARSSTAVALVAGRLDPEADRPNRATPEILRLARIPAFEAARVGRHAPATAVRAAPGHAVPGQPGLDRVACDRAAGATVPTSADRRSERPGGMTHDRPDRPGSRASDGRSGMAGGRSNGRHRTAAPSAGAPRPERLLCRGAWHPRSIAPCAGLDHLCPACPSAGQP